MKNSPVLSGIFVFTALLLFTAGLFLIGNQHKAFSRHMDYYTEITDINGIVAGSQVRLSGFNAGQVTAIALPVQPTGRFRIRLHIDSKLGPLIRENSLVTVETDGIVGAKFLQIHEGTSGSQQARLGSTLPSAEPFELSALETKVSGIVDTANSTIGDLRGRLDGTIDSIHATVDNADGMVSNANGIVTGVRRGQGTVGMLLTDPQTELQVKQAVASAQQTAANLSQASLQVGQMITDLKQRNLGQKAEDTLNNAKDATQQLDQTSRLVDTTLTEALGPDRTGADAATNLRESLSNVNRSTANLADDTEAIKHEFFFRGFFKKRGYFSLQELTPDQYRSNRFFQNPGNSRDWLGAADAFYKDASGKEVLSEAGTMQIDRFIGQAKNTIFDRPLVVEGYSDQPSNADEIGLSLSRALLVAHYLERRFHLSAKNVGIMPLNATPPPSSGENSWNGVCIVLLAKAK
jgi:phospholipid/cholesterol/gamma-HCH transport system substrate-binding protein